MIIRTRVRALHSAALQDRAARLNRRETSPDGPFLPGSLSSRQNCQSVISSRSLESDITA